MLTSGMKVEMMAGNLRDKCSFKNGIILGYGEDPRTTLGPTYKLLVIISLPNPCGLPVALKLWKIWKRHLFNVLHYPKALSR